MPQVGNIFSGEQLPVAPRVENAEMEAFHRKLLDYLRRLSGKLDRFTTGNNGAVIPAVSLYLASDQNLAASYTALSWSNELWRDLEAFAHSGAFVRVVTNGLYLITIDVELGDAAYYDVDAELRISKPDGSSTFAPTFSHARLGTTTLSATWILPLLANRRIALYLKCEDFPETGGIKSQGSRFQVLRLRTDVVNSAGEGWVDANNDDIPDGWGSVVI